MCVVVAVDTDVFLEVCSESTLLSPFADVVCVIREAVDDAHGATDVSPTAQ